MQWDATRKALQDLASDIVDEARYLLDAEKGNATKTLRGALRYWIKETKSGFRIAFGARGAGAQYVRWVEEGRGPGRRPPMEPIRQWVRAKPLKLRNLKTGRFQPLTDQNVNSAAFLIARKIGEKGTEGKEIFKRAVETYRPEIEAIQKTVAQDITTYVRTSLKYPRNGR